MNKIKKKFINYKYNALNTIGHNLISFGFWIKNKAI